MKEPGLKSKKPGVLTRNANCVASAVIAAIIMFFAYLVWKFFPFGDNVILRMDLYHQYAPLFAELYERIFGGDSLIYSFTSGLGSSFIGNYFNYLSSPSMLFVLIFGHVNIPEAIAAMVLVKAAASAYTATYFLGKISKTNDMTTAAFGLLYAFCGYFVAYYWNIMWLDAMVAFPIVILGIYYIIQKKSSLTYILSLAFVMVTNYYMAFMVCMLSVLFFLYLFFSEESNSKPVNSDYILKQKYKKALGVKLFNSKFITRGASFAFSSILAAMIAAFALLPVYFILKHSSATNSTFPSSFSTYFNIFDYLANHLAGVEPTIRSSGDAVFPNVYCGIITLVLIPVYMLSKEFSLREKIATVSVSAFFFLSFNVNVFNFIWHGLHFPNDLPYRFSFAYSFFLIFVAYKTFTKIKKIPGKDILISASLVAAFAVIVEKVGSANVDLKVVWTSIIFAICYAVVFALFKNPKYFKSSITILLITCICAELLIADTPNYKVTQTKEAYTSSYEDTKAAIDIVKNTEGEDGFYRMELSDLLTRMDNCWFYYPGVSTFTSMAYENVAKLQDNLGLFGNKINSYTYNWQTPLYNSMMSIKYIIDNNEYVPTDNYKPPVDGDFLYNKIDTVNDMKIYENKYWLPVAFGVNNSLADSWLYSDDNPFVVQNDFFYQATGVSDILTKLDCEFVSSSNIDTIDDSAVAQGMYSVYKTNPSDKSNEITVKYVVPQEQNIYTYFECNNVSSVFVSTDGFSYNQSLSNKPYVLNLGNVKAGAEVTLSFSLKDDETNGNVKHYAYGLDRDKFEKAYNQIKANGTIIITENKESYLKGDVTLSEDMLLYTSIPYDTAWQVYVDGNAVASENIVEVGNALMGVEMTAGEHTVEFKYSPAGLMPGIVLSIAGILLLVLFLVMKKNERAFFSKGFRVKYLELGKWRDAEAEAQREAEIQASGETQLVDEESEAQKLSEDSDSLWTEALKEASAFSSEQDDDNENIIEGDTNEEE